MSTDAFPKRQFAPAHVLAPAVSLPTPLSGCASF